MQDNLYKEIDRFRDEIADDTGYRRKSKTTRRPRSSFPFKRKRNFLILGGAGILLLIVLVAIFSGNHKKPSADDLAAIQARLGQLEKRIKHLEAMEGKLFVTETANTEVSLAQQLQNVTKRLDLLEKRMAPGPAKARAPLTTQGRPSPLKNERYHEVRSGDTLFRIATKYGITTDELCRLNNISPRHIIHPGQRLLVASEGMR